MNKKISTLLAAFMMLFAFTANAQAPLEEVLKSGDLYYLQETTNYVTAGEDGFVVVDAVAEAGLWKVEDSKTYDPGSAEILYIISDKAGEVLKLDGLGKWVITEVDGGITLSAAKAANKPVYVTVNEDGELEVTETADDATVFFFGEPALIELNYNEIADFTVVTLTAEHAPEILKDKITGTLLRALPSGNVDFPVVFQAIEDGKYLTAVEANPTIIHNQVGAFGARLDFAAELKDAAAGAQYFKVIKDLRNDKITLYLAAAPKLYDEDSKFIELTGAAKREYVGASKVVYAEVDDKMVLTVSALTEAGFNTETLIGVAAQGVTEYFTVEGGEGDTIKEGVYNLVIIDEEADEDADPVYLGATVGTEVEKVSLYNPEGQWIVEAKDGRYTVVSRMQGENELAGYELTGTGEKPSYLEIYDLKNGVYTFGGDKYKFEYVCTKEEAAAYQAYKVFKDSEIANKAYALVLVSGTPGVENMYAHINGENISADAKTEKEDAAMFKVVAKEFTAIIEGEGDVEDKEVTVLKQLWAGATALEDSLFRGQYMLVDRFGGQTVTTHETEATDLAGLEDAEVIYADDLDERLAPIYFSFKTEDGEKYTMEAIYTPEIAPLFVAEDPVLVSFNINTSNLEYNSKPNAFNLNYFALEEENAPEYIELANGHYTFASAEGDNKKLTNNPAKNEAVVKAETQDPYELEMFGLFVELLNAGDARPVHNVLTQYGLKPDAKEEGDALYLQAPEWDEESDGYNANLAGGAMAAIFADEAGEGIALFVTKESVVADGGYTNLKVETTVEIDEEVEPVYLAVLNNQVYWVKDAKEAHLFDVSRTFTFPTDVENPEASFEVYATEGAVIVKGATGVATITNVLGQTISKTTISSDYEVIAAPAGVVFVTVNGETVKVLVK